MCSLGGPERYEHVGHRKPERGRQRNKQAWPRHRGTQLINCPSGHPDIALTRFAVLGETREFKETTSEELK